MVDFFFIYSQATLPRVRQYSSTSITSQRRILGCNGLNMEANDTKMSALEQNKTDSLLCEHMPQEIPDVAVKTSLIVVLILCVLGNSAVCIIVSRHYQLHTVTNAYFVNMAVIQLFFALFSIPPYLRLTGVTGTSLLTEQWLCVFIGFSFEWFAALSSLALTLVAFERYYVMKNSGKKKFSAKTTGKLIFVASVWALVFAVVWTVLEGSSFPQCLKSSNISIALSCFPLLRSQTTETLEIINIIYVVMCFLMPMTLMAGLFLKMSRLLWRGSQGVRPLGVGNMKTIRFFAEIKTTRTMFFISVLHLCCWLPICIISLYLSFRRQQTHRLKLSKVKTVSMCLAFASSCINPLFYGLRNPRFSIILRQKKRRGRKRVHFNHNQERLDGQTAKAASTWGQKSQGAVLYDMSRSEETLTTSSC